jgi:predicted CoA-binding protein
MRVLVIGASLNESRYSNMAIKMLQQFEHDVFAYGLKEGVIGDVTIKTNTETFERFDTVTLYLNKTRQKGYYDYIIGLNPNRVIFNPGTANLEFYKLLDAANIFHEEACTLVLLQTDQFEESVLD